MTVTYIFVPVYDALGHALRASSPATRSSVVVGSGMCIMYVIHMRMSFCFLRIQ